MDLRVLLKLAPKAKAPGAAVADKKQRKAKGPPRTKAGPW